VADRHDGCTQKARRIEALFAVVITVIVHGEGRPVEDLLGIGEIKAVFLVLFDSPTTHAASCPLSSFDL
jgi:hypothetical protein